MTQEQIDHVRNAHELAAGACRELVRAHREAGYPRSPFTAALEKASGDLSAVCALLTSILRRQDDEAKKERWQQMLENQKNGTQG